MVVDVVDCENAAVTFAADLKLVKVFIRGCADCRVVLEGALVTSFVEMAHCKGTTLLSKKTLHTVQCDLCALAVWDEVL